MKPKVKTALLILSMILGAFVVPAQSSLKVMTFNVRYDDAIFNSDKPPGENWWVNRKEIVSGLVDFHLPDVVGMQEPHLHQIRYLEQKLPGYSWVGVAREDGKEEGEFNPLFYNTVRLKVISSGTFWLSETPGQVSRSWDAGYTRICTWALFETLTSNARFYVFNTHFDSKGKEARLQSARLLNDTIKNIAHNKPVFVTGDFNFVPGSPPYREIVSKGLSDSREVSEKPPYGPEGTITGFRFGASPRHRIDYIFVNDKVTVKNYGVLTDHYEQKYPSDHLPVMIRAVIQE